MDEPLEHQYFNWLVAKVMFVENPTPSLTYWDLLKDLHGTEFVWVLSGDDNRAEDGLELRSEFLLESRIPVTPEWMGIGCSILEMLIAFSRRAEYQTEESSDIWFWRMLEHLGFQEFNDASKYHPYHIQTTLYDLVWRQYSEDGRGGLFPLRRPHQDQTKVEIWYQFCEYLNEQDYL